MEKLSDDFDDLDFTFEGQTKPIPVETLREIYQQRCDELDKTDMLSCQLSEDSWEDEPTIEITRTIEFELPSKRWTTRLVQACKDLIDRLLY